MGDIFFLFRANIGLERYDEDEIEGDKSDDDSFDLLLLYFDKFGLGDFSNSRNFRVSSTMLLLGLVVVDVILLLTFFLLRFFLSNLFCLITTRVRK